MIERSDNKKEFFADLHLHSRFSRACSNQLNIPNLEKWARIKGLDLLGTGDFTHPEWLEELKRELQDNGSQVYKTKTGFKFILTGEISLIYSDENAKKGGRRVHLVLLVPSFEVVDKINSFLDSLGRRDYDGRPIFNIACDELVKKMHEISDKIEVIPAHVWTPWFGLYGSRSGFDSLEQAFKNQKEKIHAIETGISSTPEMNLKLKELQDKTIVSFSDAHSFWPWRLGREATIFSSIESYDEILNQIRENKIIGTVEVNPAYGKYHYDGHRLCNFSSSPSRTKELKGICPVCNKPLTVGVDYRVEELADSNGAESKKVYEILPLHEIISAAINSGINTKKTWGIYNDLIKEFGNEFNVLLSADVKELLRVVDDKVADLIIKNRRGKIKVKPGYDGVYGEMILEEGEGQKKLF
jgi:uncharacterized protein (TIGR00375 family)